MVDQVDPALLAAMEGLDPASLEELVYSMPAGSVEALLAVLGGSDRSVPVSPLVQGRELDEAYVSRSHLEYLSERLRLLTADVEAGQSRRLVVSMPPRMGKSQLTSVYLPIWLLRSHPDWKIGLVSHSPSLATAWGRQVRRVVEGHGADLGLGISRDAGAVGEWETPQGGGVWSRSVGQSITGLGFKVMLIDDPVKDIASAHSEKARQGLWDWWTANASTRLEPPSLVIVTATRWHEDDMIGRLLSEEHEGDSSEWEVISFPAIAEEDDVLGRSPGEPLISPIVEETVEEAVERWAAVKRTVGSYNWSSLYQQRPAPAKGSIFDTGWWRYWTTDPSRVTDDGKVVLLEESALEQGRWLDSWDMAFKDKDSSDFVVGQRWVRVGPRRILVGQRRGRWAFTRTLEELRSWSHGGGPYGSRVHQRVVEDKANGSAIIDTIKEELSGTKAVSPRDGKVSRARAVTPEIESGHVLLPHPSDPGNEWVSDLLSELRNFPNDAHDDQVDALTQALSELREEGRASMTVPGRAGRTIDRNVGSAARSSLTAARRQRGPGGR